MASTVELGILLKARDEASGVMKNVGAAAAAIGVAFLGAAGVAIKAAADEQVGVERLSQAMRNAVIAESQHVIATSKNASEVRAATASLDNLDDIMKHVTASTEKNIAAMERSTAFSDGEMRDALSILVAQTGNVDDAFNRMALAQDFARGTGMDLATASKLMGKVTDENVNVFKKFGISVEKGAESSELFGKIQEKFGGQAAAYAHTAAGAMTIFKNQVDNLTEDFGSFLLPIVTQGISIATDFIDAIRGSGAIEATAAAFGTVVTILGEMFGVLTGSAPDAGAALKGALGPGAASEIMGAVALIREAVRTAMGFITDTVMPKVQAALGFLQDHWESVAFAMKVIAVTVIVPLFVAWAAAAAAAAAATIVALAPVLIPIAAIGLAAFALHEAWENDFMGIREIAETVLSAVGGFIEGAITIVTSLWQAASTMAGLIKGAFDSLPGPVQAAINIITAPISGLISLVQSAISWLQSLGIAQSSASLGSNADVAHNAGERSAIHAASGFNGDVSGPTLFLAGEGGAREHVSITPEGGASGGDVHLHFHGPVYGMDDFDSRVSQVVREKGRLGSFRGVFAPAGS